MKEKFGEKWDRRFIDLARHISSWSKDPSTQTGAVIVDSQRRVVSVGYNGLPMGVQDLEERLNVREVKYKMIVHCERNALLFANRSLDNCVLYTWPFMSCSVCAGMVIQSGISRCVAPLNNNPRWVKDFELSAEMFEESGVVVDLYPYEEFQ
jgi:dCMP deaminase